MKGRAKGGAKAERLWETGRSVQVDICPEEAGFVASIGRVSLWLKHEEARDMVTTLTRALIRAAALREKAEPDFGPAAMTAALAALLRVAN